MRSVTLTPTRKPDGHTSPFTKRQAGRTRPSPSRSVRGREQAKRARRGCPFKIRANVLSIRQTPFRHAERKRLQRQLEEQSSNDGRQNLICRTEGRRSGDVGGAGNID